MRKLAASAALYALAFFACFMLAAQGGAWNAAATAWMTVSLAAFAGAFTIAAIALAGRQA
jgi:hypothetical protein